MMINAGEMGFLKGNASVDVANAYSIMARLVGIGVTGVHVSGDAAAFTAGDCQLNLGRHDFCQVHCDLLCNTGLRSVRPAGEQRIVRSIRRGDSECFLFLADKGSRVVPREEMQPVPMPPVTEEMRIHLAPNYIYWYWLIMLDALADRIGAEKAEDQLAPKMNRMGRTLRNWFSAELQESAVNAAAEPFRRLTASISSDEDIATIEGCPFAGHGGLVCALMHDMIDGLAEAGGSRVEWLAEVPRGDNSCCMRVTAKREVLADRELLQMLKARLVRGEISFEEYERIRRELDN
jgi:hypothetical protein